MHQELSWKEKLVYPFLICAGIILLCAVSPGMNTDRGTFIFIAVFAASCFLLHLKRFALRILEISLSEKKGARTRRGGTRWIMDEILLFAALFLKGTAVAAWIIVIASFSFQVYLLADYLYKITINRALTEARREHPALSSFAILIEAMTLLFRKKDRRPFPFGQVLFGFTSPFNRVIMIVPSGIVYQIVNHDAPLLSSWTNLAAVLLMYLTYFTIATFLSSLTIILRERRPLNKLGVIWWDYYAAQTFPIFMLCPLGLLFALIYLRKPYALILIAVPLIAMHRAMKNYEIILQESQQFIDSLAHALDARDHYTYGHSHRVAQYARMLAEELDMSPQDIDDIERAGRIHDLGKIAIPDAILRKQGRLDEDEYTIMKSHALAVKELFDEKLRLSSRIPVELAYSHHERYDGKGYIFGKKGEEIPPGARILSVADTFDALTSDRPYRKGFTVEAAIECLRQEAGTQLDPAIVHAFIRLCRKGDIQKIMTSGQGTE